MYSGNSRTGGGKHAFYFLSIACAVLFVLAGCSKKEVKAPRDPAVPVTVAKVETIPLDRSISIIGTLYAKDEATVGAQVDGQVEKTRVDFGDRVKEGQELALIDTTSFEALANQAAANVTKAQASATNAERVLTRTQELQKGKISPQSELDTAISGA